MIIKIYSVQYGKQIAGLVDFIITVYKENTKSANSTRYAIFESFANYTEIFFKLALPLYSVSLVLYFFYPMYMYVLDREIVTLMPLYLPKVDEHSAIGYGILTVYHLLIMVFALVASCASDFIFIMIIINVLPLAKVLSSVIHDLNDELEKPKMNINMCNYKFRNMLRLHGEIYQ